MQLIHSSSSAARRIEPSMIFACQVRQLAQLAHPHVMWLDCDLMGQGYVSTNACTVPMKCQHPVDGGKIVRRSATEQVAAERAAA